MKLMKEQKFLLTDDYGQPKVIEQLAGDLSVKIETTQAETLAIYDTFDWRLYEKSLVLYGDGNRLLLRRLFDREIIQSVDLEDRPVFVWDLPEGELKARLAPIVEMCALLRLTDIQTRSTSYRVLSQAEKTVVWLICEEVCSSPERDGPTLASYVWLRPIRGYPKYARQAVNRLEKLGLSAIEAEDIYFKALETAGKKPGDYSSKLALELTPDMRADEAAKVIHRFLLGVIKTNEAYIEQDIDTEFLHDFRVAVRRTRSALSRIRAVFPAEITDRFKADFAYISKLSNELRDLDVYLLDEDRYRAMLPEVLRDDIDPLFELLRQKRSKALQGVINGLNSKKYGQILADWEAFLNEPASDSPPAPNASRPIIDLARERIYKRYRRVVKSGKRILENSEDEMLHGLRIECKKLRYLMEFFACLFPAKDINRLLRQLKKLQNNLGDFNDLCVQQEYLLSIAAELPGDGHQSTGTILAVGSLIGRLDAEKSKVRDAFAQTYSQ